MTNSTTLDKIFLSFVPSGSFRNFVSFQTLPRTPMASESTEKTRDMGSYSPIAREVMVHNGAAHLGRLQTTTRSQPHQAVEYDLLTLNRGTDASNHTSPATVQGTAAAARPDNMATLPPPSPSESKLDTFVGNLTNVLHADEPLISSAVVNGVAVFMCQKGVSERLQARRDYRQLLCGERTSAVMATLLDFVVQRLVDQCFERGIDGGHSIATGSNVSQEDALCHQAADASTAAAGRGNGGRETDGR